ncbi:MAG: hypothetical protein WC314_07550 [Vulcanimicrobiota bacterium]
MKYLVRALSITLGLVFGFIFTEIGLRFYYPDGGIPAAHLELTADEKMTSFVEHEECGYLPIVGKGLFGPEGCLKNDYDVANPKAERVLFAGDSVTHRARIIDALKALYGEESYEYWNAGVESFNTMQEWVLYREHNHKINPDHVVLTFHNNDFRATPLVVRERGQIKVYQPGLDINPWLFRKSYVYRWAWPSMEDKPLREQQVREGLQEFKSALGAEGIRFTVVLHPMLKPYSEWNDDEIESRENSLRYFEEMDLRVIDLLPTLEKAISDGVNLTEAPGDYLHPGDELAALFAEELKRQRLLETDTANDGDS